MKKIPDTQKWLPKKDSSETLKDIFYKRCLHVESLILSKAKQEQELNLQNFDSGLGTEDIIREEFRKIFPERYGITKGILNDRNGYTSGDHDIIIFNKIWFPFLNSGASTESRKFHFPIEGAYAIGEVKQTLTVNSLDLAMQKLIIAKRLERAKTPRTRITENREFDDCPHGFTNPLYSFIIALSLDKKFTTDDLFLRFFEINKKLKRDEIVNALCVLSQATILWSYYDEDRKQFSPATFCDFDKDYNKPIIPILLATDKIRKNSLYDLIMNLSAHLNNSILGSEDIAIAYGNNYNHVKIPPINQFSINPK